MQWIAYKILYTILFLLSIMDILIVSDDLSGAAGMASMIGKGIPVISYNNIALLRKFNSKITSIDIETRNSDDAIKRLTFIKKIKSDALILTRIDTLLRGSTSDFIKFMANYGKLIITDTIPDYGRYTCNGNSVCMDDILSIENAIPLETKDYIEIAESRTYNDIRRLAEVCIQKNYLPVDPGILLKMYIEMI